MPLRSFWNLLVTWWKVDRVRVSLREGEFLRLPVGTMFVFDGEQFEVIERAVIARETESLVAYRCVAGGRTVRLLVTPGRGILEVDLVWEEAKMKRVAHPMMFELWPRRVIALPRVRGSE